MTTTKTNPATTSEAVALTASDLTYPGPWRGVHANEDGILSVLLEDDPEGASPRQFQLRAGILYPYAIRFIEGTGASTCTDFVLVR
jgi:hypothetical protein